MKRLIVLLCILSVSAPAWGWGSKGHNIIAAVAAANMKPRAAKKLDAVLEGRTLVYYSDWMDGVRKSEPYRHTATWHYINVDEDFRLETAPREPKGDVITATTEIIETLKKGGLSDSLERLNVKYLIHLIGDLHCPMHAGRAADRSGNLIPVRWFGTPTNLHAVWDDFLIESVRKWSYTEWQQNLDILDKRQKEALATGTPTDWVKESIAMSRTIYDAIPQDGILFYDYLYHFAPVVEQRLYEAGIRLAAVLNDLYG